jgi:hypothetical protein
VTHQLTCSSCMQLQREASLFHESATVAGKRAREPIPGVKAPPKVTTGGQHSDTPAAKVQRVDSGTPSASTRKLSTQRRELGHCANVVRCKYLLPCRMSSPAGAPLLQCCAVGCYQAGIIQMRVVLCCSEVPLLTPRQRSSVKAPPPNMEPTPALRIDNFMRPCTLPQVLITTVASFGHGNILGNADATGQSIDIDLKYDLSLQRCRN